MDSQTSIMATADRLLDRMFSWMEQREICAKKLKKLAKELESLRKNCNVSECTGSSMSVLGAACLLGALFTGGAAAPVLVLAGAVYSGVGVSISVATKITEHFKSSDTMKEAMMADKKINEIGEEIQKLFKQLKEEKKKLDPDVDSDELDQHVMAEFLTAIGRRSGVKGKISVRTVNNETEFFLDAGYETLSFSRNELKSRFHAGQRHKMLSFSVEITLLVPSILAVFAVQAGGKNSKFLFAKGAEELSAAVKGTAIVRTVHTNTARTHTELHNGISLLHVQKVGCLLLYKLQIFFEADIIEHNSFIDLLLLIIRQ